MKTSIQEICWIWVVSLKNEMYFRIAIVKLLIFQFNDYMSFFIILTVGMNYKEDGSNCISERADGFRERLAGKGNWGDLPRVGVEALERNRCRGRQFQHYWRAIQAHGLGGGGFTSQSMIWKCWAHFLIPMYLISFWCKIEIVMCENNFKSYTYLLQFLFFMFPSPLLLPG